ncbi:MAG: TOBE domain-containing protein, partial [Spirochaetales bacterium]|nr:TOBE domain-containing protein [Spirochaetales bacterium]
RQPKVFLFDEPLSNLDAKLRVQMRAEISSLHNRLKATMIYVTHDQVEAMTMADKIVVMKDGFIQQIGSPLELYNKPTNRFVAGFIGSPPMNFMNVTVKEEGSKLVLDEGAFSIDVEGCDYLKNYVGKNVVFGIRPEDLHFADKEKKGETIPAKITVIEPLGAEIHLYMDTDNHQFIARTGPEIDLKVDATVYFKPDFAKAVFFDLETEKRIDE